MSTNEKYSLSARNEKKANIQMATVKETHSDTQRTRRKAHKYRK